MYKTRDDKSEELATRFKKAFGRDVTIDFLGVWFVSIPVTGMYWLFLIIHFGCHRDTVASVGHFYSPTLPFVGSNDMIKVFRHALALDEVRMTSTHTLSTLLRRPTFDGLLTASYHVSSKLASHPTQFHSTSKTDPPTEKEGGAYFKSFQRNHLDAKAGYCTHRPKCAHI